MSEEKKNNVVPFIKEKKTRDIIQAQFTEASRKKVKELLDSVNEKIGDLKDSVRKQNEYLSEKKLLNEYGAARGKEDPVYGEATLDTSSPSVMSTLDQAALEAEYRRKQDAMRKKREENNKSVTRGYGLRKPDRNK